MSSSISRSEFARLSLTRLAFRLAELIRAAHSASEGSPERLNAFCEGGRLIYEESKRGFVLCDVVTSLKSAPWLHVIGELKREHPDLNVTQQSLLEAVNCYLESRAIGRAGGALPGGARNGTHSDTK